MQKRELAKINKLKDQIEEYAESERKKSKNYNLAIDVQDRIRRCATLLECAVEDLNCVISTVEQG